MLCAMETIRAGTMIAVLLLTACSAGTGSENADSSPRATVASTSPTPSAGEPSVGADPLASCDGVAPAGDPVVVEVGTASWAFDTEQIEGPIECQPFVIVFMNRDVPLERMMGGTYKHSIEIILDGLLGPPVFTGEPIGTGTTRYEIPGLPAGAHYFHCTNHGVMSGDLIVAPAG